MLHIAKILAQVLTSVSCYFSPLDWLSESIKLQLLQWLQKGREDTSSTLGGRHAGLCDVGKKMPVTLENTHKEARSESQASGKAKNWNKVRNSYRRSSCISASFWSTWRSGRIEPQWAEDPEIKGSLHTLKWSLRKGTLQSCPQYFERHKGLGLTQLHQPLHGGSCKSVWTEQIQNLLRAKEHALAFMSVWQSSGQGEKLHFCGNN